MFEKKKPDIELILASAGGKKPSKPVEKDDDMDMEEDDSTDPEGEAGDSSDDKKLNTLAEELVDAVSSGDVAGVKDALKSFVANCMKNY